MIAHVPEVEHVHERVRAVVDRQAEDRDVVCLQKSAHVVEATHVEHAVHEALDLPGREAVCVRRNNEGHTHVFALRVAHSRSTRSPKPGSDLLVRGEKPNSCWATKLTSC